MSNRPILAITLGDPCGSGPEITVKACSEFNIYDICRPLIIGDECVVRQALQFTGLGNKLKINTVADVKNALFEYGVIDIFDIGAAGFIILHRDWKRTEQGVLLQGGAGPLIELLASNSV